MKARFPGNNLGQSPQVETYSEVPSGTSIRTVPFDYVVTLDLRGEKDNVVQNVINVSVEGYFVATGISYSMLIDERKIPRDFGPSPNDDPENIILSSEPSVIPGYSGGPIVRTTSGEALKIFGKPNAAIDILIDWKKVASTTLDQNGRAIVHGDPLSPRNVIVVRDITNSLSSSEIHITRRQNRVRLVTPQFGPEKPAINGKTFDIVGTPGAKVSISVYPNDKSDPKEEVQGRPIPAADNTRTGEESGLLKVTLRDPLERGDTVVVENVDNNFGSVYQLPYSPLNIRLGSIPENFLGQGFKLNPFVLRSIQAGIPVPPEELENPFQPCGIFPENLGFRYAIIDNGPERELQSQPIHNIAGLGIANGDRPFRVFPKPIVFAPRSVILFRVWEISGGPGTLYFVLQGYKVLGATGARIPE